MGSCVVSSCRLVRFLKMRERSTKLRAVLHNNHPVIILLLCSFTMKMSRALSWTCKLVQPFTGYHLMVNYISWELNQMMIKFTQSVYVTRTAPVAQWTSVLDF